MDTAHALGNPAEPGENARRTAPRDRGRRPRCEPLRAEMWEMLGREDVLEQGCHATCPASCIGMAKLYNPNMKLDVLTIPPRVRSQHVFGFDLEALEPDIERVGFELDDFSRAR